MRKTKTKRGEKTISYVMEKDVLDALELIMRRNNINTMTKAINYCIVHHMPLAESLIKEQVKSDKLLHSKSKIETELTKLVQFIEFVKKYTKTS